MVRCALELDLLAVGSSHAEPIGVPPDDVPLPSYVWYQDMADFAEGVSDQRAGRSLARAIQGTGAFRRFKDRLHEDYPHLLPAWHTFHAARAERRTVQWLIDNSLIDDTAAGVLADHPDADLL